MTHAALVPTGALIQFEFDGVFWVLLTGRHVLRGSVTANLQKAAAAIPAGDVSDEATFAVAGAAAGMKVRVAPTTVISGDALLIGRVTAANTVGIRAQNLNLGGTLAIGSASYDVTVGYE